MNLPNKITITRIFLIPLFMIFIIPLPTFLIDSVFMNSVIPNLKDFNNLINNYGHYFGAIIFIIAATTDSIDGYLARKTNQITKLGIFLDPIADKLMITAALIALCQRNQISGWAAMIIIGREFIVTGLRLVAAGEGIIISAGKWGKIKMIIQVIAVSLALLDNFPFKYFSTIPVDKILIFIAVIVTIYSGYDYIKKNFKLIHNTVD